jgi:2,3-dihydroxyethylbenzene 1,2-dioxygenase
MKDLPATYRFYTTLLGMRGGIEYKIPTPDGKVLDLLFMHCNDRDHTIAFGLESGKRINHIMIEAQSFDDLAFTYDIVRKKKIPIGVSLGKHSNDHQYSFYFFNPSGWMFEYGWGSRPASHQTEYYTEDIYGHEFQPNVLGASWDVVNVSDAAE